MWNAAWPAPEGLPVRHVYAGIVDDHGRVLLLRMPGEWNLPGGTRQVYARERVTVMDTLRLLGSVDGLFVAGEVVALAAFVRHDHGADVARPASSAISSRSGPSAE